MPEFSTSIFFNTKLVDTVIIRTQSDTISIMEGDPKLTHIDYEKVIVAYSVGSNHVEIFATRKGGQRVYTILFPEEITVYYKKEVGQKND
jgi:arginine deiminase